MEQNRHRASDQIGLVLKKDTQHEKERLINALRKWFVSAVKCNYEPGFVPKYCLVLVGEQGIGKTPFLKSFLPPVIAASQIDNPLCLDQKYKLAETFILFIEEVDDWLKIKQNEANYRAFMTAQIVNGGHHRIASFLACANDTHFLSTPGGTDRFVCFRVDRIWNRQTIQEQEETLKAQGSILKKRQAAEDLDISRAWAAAYRLYREGYDPLYNSKELRLNRLANSTVNNESSTADILFRYIEPAGPQTPGATFYQPSDICEYLNKAQEWIKFNPHALGRLLSSAGVRRQAHRNRYGYWVVPKVVIEGWEPED